MKPGKMVDNLAFFGGINFILHWIVSQFIGGSALGGKIANGSYFLAKGGEYEEVSATVYWISLGHIAVIAIIVVFCIAIGIFLRVKDRKK